jgi:hypothetical protein
MRFRRGKAPTKETAARSSWPCTQSKSWNWRRLRVRYRPSLRGGDSHRRVRFVSRLVQIRLSVGRWWPSPTHAERFVKTKRVGAAADAAGISN